MFDRQHQPRWLKLVNLLAVLCIILLVFVPLGKQPVWMTSILLVLFVAIAGINFWIQFRDVLVRGPAGRDDQSASDDLDEAEEIKTEQK